MGCTNSKENPNNPPSTTIDDHNQQLINDQFRKWLKANRPKADEYVLKNILSKNQQPNDIDDYRVIVKKSLDLLSERYDIKTIHKLNKLVQKEVLLASPKKVATTIDILKQTAEKLQQGQIILDDSQPQTTTAATNGDINNETKTSGQLTSGEPGSILKEALEKARILFYKGKQAAIFANPNGGYNVRIIDENDDVLNQDGNLLRSIIVTEVKMRPKPVPTSTPNVPVPPPPPSKLLNEQEIGDDFRRSIDAALKGLESIYHTSPSSNPNDENQQQQQDLSKTDYHPKLVGAVNNMNEILLDTIETISQSEIGNPIPPKHYDTVEKLVPVISNESKDNHPSKQSSPTQENAQSSKLIEEPIENTQTSISEEHNKNLSDSSSPPSLDRNTMVKSPSHNVTYTEIIRSESHDGEQSRRFITESYDEHPLNNDEQTTTHKVITKSEFSNHPLLGEKIMEQSVQVITVKVRNETKTATTIPSPTSDNDKNTTDITT